ncbi:MAG: transcription antitermination factor NusB [bacterium]
MVNSNDSRHNARKVALAALFEWSFRPVTLEESLQNAGEFIGEGGFKSELAQELVSGVKNNIAGIDEIITTNAPAWPIAQIAKIDLSILRQAIYELKFSESGAPPKVVVDEAVELGKEYGSETSGSFINGVLGNILENGTKNS